MDSSKRFVTEGIVDLGPKEDFFIFLDGEHLGKLLRKQFDVEAEAGYTQMGRLRITVERVEEP